jgi:hypothetical protein
MRGSVQTSTSVLNPTKRLRWTESWGLIPHITKYDIDDKIACVALKEQQHDIDRPYAHRASLSMVLLPQSQAKRIK